MRSFPLPNEQLYEKKSHRRLYMVSNGHNIRYEFGSCNVSLHRHFLLAEILLWTKAGPN